MRKMYSSVLEQVEDLYDPEFVESYKAYCHKNRWRKRRLLLWTRIRMWFLRTAEKLRAYTANEEPRF